MTEPLLYALWIDPLIEHVRGARMSQGVGGNVAAQAGGQGVLTGHKPDRLSGQARAGGIEKEDIRLTAAQQLDPGTGQIGLQGDQSAWADGRRPGSGAPPCATRLTAFQIKVRHPERDRFRNPHPG